MTSFPPPPSLATTHLVPNNNNNNSNTHTRALGDISISGHVRSTFGRYRFVAETVPPPPPL